MYPPFEKRFSSLIRYSHPSSGGDKKEVYKASDGQRTLAAKVFRAQRDDGIRVNRQRASWYELIWYGTAYHRTELKLWPFTPQPFYLLTNDSDKPIGLAVEWVEGKPLDAHNDYGLLLRSEFQEFADSLAETIMAGFVPHPNMYSQSNLLFVPKRNKPLAFSTCRIYKIPESRVEEELHILARSLEPLKRFVV